MTATWVFLADLGASLHRCGEFFSGVVFATAVCWWRWRRARR